VENPDDGRTSSAPGREIPQRQSRGGHVEYSFKRIADKKAVFASRGPSIDGYGSSQIHDQDDEAPQAGFYRRPRLPRSCRRVDADLGKEARRQRPSSSRSDFAAASLQRFGYYDRSSQSQSSSSDLPGPAVASESGRRDRRHPGRPLAQAAQFKSSNTVKPSSIDQQHSHHRVDGQNSEPIRSNAKVKALAMCLDKAAVQKIAFADEDRQKWSWVPYGTWAYKQEEGYPFDPQGQGVARGRRVSEWFLIRDQPAEWLRKARRSQRSGKPGLQQAGVTLNIQTMGAQSGRRTVATNTTRPGMCSPASPIRTISSHST
jgi:hypothetical protein